MKKIVPLLLLLLISNFSMGQAFKKDTKVVALGLGIGSSFAPSNSNQLPGLSIQYEQGVWQIGETGVISLGGYVGYKGFSLKTSSGSFESESKWNYSIVGARSAFHFHGIDNEKLDLYAGLMLGYYLLNYSYSDNSNFNVANAMTTFSTSATSATATSLGGSSGNILGFTLYGGARYYLAENIGVFGELGYGVSFLNVGGVVRF